MNVRPARMSDAAILFRWRTEGETADWYEGPRTSLEDHRKWLYLRLASPAVHIWIVEKDDLPIGVIRLDSNDELSVEIDPAWRGMGYGTKAIQWACDHAEGRVKANVDQSNDAAARAFLKAGFQHRADVNFYLWRKP